jgi:translation initiation factor IF-1
VEDFLYSLPELTGANEVIARVTSSRGTNIFEIEIPTAVPGGNVDVQTTGSMRTELAMMPSKFKKLIWMKRGDYIIVSNSNVEVEVASDDVSETVALTGDADAAVVIAAPDSVFKLSQATSTSLPAAAAANTGKVQFLIDHVLTKEQIMHLDKIGKWPAAFVVPYLQAQGPGGAPGKGRSAGYDDPMAGYGGEEDDGSEYESEEEEAPKVDKMGNTIE